MTGAMRTSPNRRQERLISVMVRSYSCKQHVGSCLRYFIRAIRYVQCSTSSGGVMIKYRIHRRSIAHGERLFTSRWRTYALCSYERLEKRRGAQSLIGVLRSSMVCTHLPVAMFYPIPFCSCPPAERCRRASNYRRSQDVTKTELHKVPGSL
ncbi:hypothetical protein BD413DRAFT_73107 [Trametes elegans]|nr:hypothetical protein BD413DRAFT_73107 [Trametes elegans]